MRRFLKRHSYTGRVPAEILVGRLRAALMEVGEGSTAGRSYGALALADQLELLNKQLKGFDDGSPPCLPVTPTLSCSTASQGQDR